MGTETTKGGDKKIERHLLDKRDELSWALGLQDYKNAEIARIFNVHRSLINQIMRRKPAGWMPKWKKIQD